MLILFIIFIILGLLMYRKPQWIWWVTESWLTERKHPSKVYIFIIRIIGAICFIWSIIGALVDLLFH